MSEEFKPFTRIPRGTRKIEGTIEVSPEAEAFIRQMAEKVEAEKIKQVMDKVEDEAINGDAIAQEREFYRQRLLESQGMNRHQRRRQAKLDRRK